MTKKRLNSMPDYQARMPRQPHQPEQSRTWTLVPGAITPMYWQICHPGSKLNFTNSIYARYQPIKLPFVGSCDIHVDAFFVPLSLLYTPALSLFYQTDDLVTSAISPQTMKVDRFPVVDLDNCIVKYLQDVVGSVYTDRNSCAQRQYTSRAGYTTPQNTLSPNVFDCTPKSSCRFLNCLGYDSQIWFNATPSEVSSHFNPVTTPWAACAYNAIYQLYPMYRNSDREGKDYSYNLDTFASVSTPVVGATYIDRLFTMRYVDEYKDYFNSIKVSPVGSSVGLIGGSQSWNILSTINSYLTNVTYTRIKPNGTVSSDDSDVTSVAKEASGGLNFSAPNIRQLFMVDKLLRVTGRADKNFEAQMLAHYGIEVPHDDYHNITHVSHDVFTLDTKEITSLANTFDGSSGSALGEFGGNGQVRGDGRERHFTAPCHGVFIINVVVIPRYRYQVGVDKLHDLSSMDKFWQPEFDEVGMQPLFEYEARMYNNVPLSSARAGWQFGYEQFKRKPDIVSDAFRSPRSNNLVNEYSSWVLSKVPYSHFDKTGSYETYSFVDGLPWDCFKVSPTSLNGVMQILYDTGWNAELTYDTRHLLYQTDPIIMDFTCHMGETNFMSEYSEPELG